MSGAAVATAPESEALSERVAAAGHAPIAVDAMGGDDAPSVVVEGARRAWDDGTPIILVGRPGELGDVADIPVLAASEVIAMDDDPGPSVRRRKDSSLVRSAEAVRDGWAGAMVSAGNTGAAMASALLRMGRIKGVSRPAIAIPIPKPSGRPTVMLDAGANAECQPEWLVQFAIMGVALARTRFGMAKPRVGLLSIGEESVKGNGLVKSAHALLESSPLLGATGAPFVGNVEGRDLMSPDVDVVVTDGFTGNVALKTLEGALSGIVGLIEQLAGDDADQARPLLRRAVDELDPENTGGAMLLGVNGVCVISHGSSSAWAIANAIRVARETVLADTVGALASLVRP
ncbi:MAG: phosphate acyltransferase PlsX [Actinomycetota bacterium]|nr:phosphate acyltransferase PlsX [Actinomycetota bacterium]